MVKPQQIPYAVSKKQQKEVNPMTKEAVESVIGRAVLDGQFREDLFANPDEALGGYELAEEEVAGLKSIDAETMESLAGTLDERISKALGFMLFQGGYEPGWKNWVGPAVGPDNIPV
jgi:hypothetical protein